MPLDSVFHYCSLHSTPFYNRNCHAISHPTISTLTLPTRIREEMSAEGQLGGIGIFHPAFYFTALVTFQSTAITAEEFKRSRIHLQKQNAKTEGATFIDAI